MKTIIFPKEDDVYAYRMPTPLIKDDNNTDTDYLELAKKDNVIVLEQYIADEDCTVKVYKNDGTCDTYNAKAGDLILTFSNNLGIKHRVTVVSNSDIKENVDGILAEKKKKRQENVEKDCDCECNKCCCKN